MKCGTAYLLITKIMHMVKTIKMTDKEYFATDFITNSKLRDFASYDKWGARLLTPDKYLARHIEKTMEFKLTDPVIVGKIVDAFFDWTGEKVWEKYIPVARRSGKEIKKLAEERYEAENTTGAWTNSIIEASKEEKDIRLAEIEKELLEDGYMEITGTIKSEAEEWIKWGQNFKQLRDFLQKEDTESQVILKTDINITDWDWVIHTITMGGKPDFLNKKEKLIVDLKYTGSLNMVIEWLQFRWEPKLTAAYIRQCSIYNKMCGGDYSAALAVVTSTGVKWISISNEILVAAWDIIKKDILDLDKYLKDPDSLNETIFVKSDTDMSLDNLQL